MLRRLFTAACAVLLIGSVGCRTQVDKVWTFGEFQDHAEKIDSEFDQLHTDIKDNVFGVEKAAEEPIWHTYRS